jgi:hypothetical protein
MRHHWLMILLSACWYKIIFFTFRNYIGYAIFVKQLRITMINDQWSCATHFFFFLPWAYSSREQNHFVTGKSGKGCRVAVQCPFRNVNCHPPFPRNQPLKSLLLFHWKLT